MYCIRKLQSFNVNSDLMEMFAMSVICSVWSYCVVGWGENAGVPQKNRTDKLNERAGKMAGLTITMDRVYYDAGA